MAMQLNPQAVALAEQLIAGGDYRINSVWREAQPSTAAAVDYLDRMGYDALARWFLVIDTAAPEGGLERLRFPIGDFQHVHRNALVAARDAAAKTGDLAIHEAADELLFFFDRITAC